MHGALLGRREEVTHRGLSLSVNNKVATREERQISERKMEVNICRMSLPPLDRRTGEDGD